MKKIVIVGGGLAGLVTAVKLTRSGIPCTVIEKKTYPFHRVCGEYISNETVPFLKSLGLYPEEFSPPQISRLMLSAINGRSQTLPLDLGGFGISRFSFDYFIYQEAVRLGVEFLLDTEVSSIRFQEDSFHVISSKKEIHADVVIGSFGKRSRLDINMNRTFIQQRSPYVGIKYHVTTDFPMDLIALHNFEGGYCGVSNIEQGKVNICYLTHRDGLKRSGNIAQFQESVMFRNPHLKSLFESSDFLFTSPETINEISFETKSPVEDHVLMTGDAAGMITPLCGNGMAMAIHSAKLVSERVIRFCREPSYSRAILEKDYADAWRKHFAARLWRGRQVQKLFGHRWASGFAVNLVKYSRPAANYIVRNTHGEVF